MPVKFAGIKRFEYRWPDGSRERYNAIAYDVIFFGLKHNVLVCFTTRKAFGRKRRRVVIFIDGWPEAEFAEADDYSQTGHLVAMIKKPDGTFMSIKDVHSEYFGLPILDHSSCINKSFGGREGTAALVVTEDDHKTMIRHAIIQS
ncbi:MAG: hypothetical protein QXH37_05815, partial [Candidatus Bathyarchaeia archaeon]